MSDVVERAKAALEGTTEGPWTWTHGMDARAMVLGPDNLRVKLEGYRDAEFIASARSLVPELIAEVERLTPRRIETAEELDALPTHAIVVHVVTGLDRVFRRSRLGFWTEIGGYDYEPPDVPLPCRVIHLPEES
ncbi:hypothetical protein SEA_SCOOBYDOOBYDOO_3 [Mycobacterium phage ScoobyDoobyDoo]|nr:hypothetical protein SEA_SCOOBYDOOBYDOO_3 [Mycobacterium phage ScoobyDoobyDoo]